MTDLVPDQSAITSDPLHDPATLASLGWSHMFGAQISDDDRGLLPVRVMSAHRRSVAVVGPGFDHRIAPHINNAVDEEDYPTVGDWLLIDPETDQINRILTRKSLFKRKAPGSDQRIQLIAANVDTLFIVTSCNPDFNIARIERYLVLASDAGATPVIVLTKSDQSETADDYAAAARAIQPGLMVEVVNALDPASLSGLAPWCALGQTVALLGSSGVGKSTLTNSLANLNIVTQDMRADDAKGRHTTTGRALYHLPQGGLILDTPGMRELQLADVGAGLDAVFADIIELATQCKFRNCAHASEPGCAVTAALKSGNLDLGRVQRWQKLSTEDSANTESIANRRARERDVSKMITTATRHKKHKGNR